MNHVLAGYDESAIFAHEVDYQMEQLDSEGETITEDEATTIVNDDYDLFSNEWDYFTETLTELLEKKAHNGNAWKVIGKELGWLKRDGYKYTLANTVIGKELGWRKLDSYKYTLANTATELLRAILPETDCTISVYNYKNGYQVKASHHDAPTGESYYVTPCALSTYENNY